MSRDDVSTLEVILTGPRPAPAAPAAFTVVRADSAADRRAWQDLRHDVFVSEQELFPVTDRDDVDDDPRTVVLLARTPDGTLLGGVRVHPAVPGRDLGWWRGSRLAVSRPARSTVGVGPALVRAACALAETLGALRFDATIQSRHEPLFRRLGWRTRRPLTLHGRPHLLVEWPVDRIQRRADASKGMLGALLHDLTGVPSGFAGDDGAPVPGSELVAACDAILPSMVERDPEWAGWCAVLVNVNDLCAMGATPVGLLDAVAGRDASFVRRVLRGLRDASQAWGVPVLGGHTQVGVPAALSVTALGRTEHPVPGGGARPEERLRVTADLGGGWRPGYTGAQWDSSSHRTPAELRATFGVVPGLAPTAAKDVSMAGLVGTLGMLAEASSCAAVVDVDAVPVPPTASPGDWMTCFPGFAVVTAEHTDRSASVPDFLATAVCGDLVAGSGVRLRWPDGLETEAVHGPVTRMGAA